jgi:molybdopterin-guanine dinucleotide biosynthesis protein A
MIEIAAGLLRAVDISVTVVAPLDRDYSFLGCKIISDQVAGLGPIGGIHTAFLAYPDRDLLVLTCDMPRLTEDAIRNLLDLRRKEWDAVIYGMNQEQVEPFPGLYRAALRNLFQEQIAKGNYSMQETLKKVARSFILPIENPNIFINMNRPTAC